MNRRQFLHSAAAAALTTLPNSSTAAESVRSNKMIGLQVGAVSFVDEGVEKAMDEFQRDNLKGVGAAVHELGFT